jgi:glutathione S-transferase
MIATTPRRVLLCLVSCLNSHAPRFGLEPGRRHRAHRTYRRRSSFMYVAQPTFSRSSSGRSTLRAYARSAGVFAQPPGATVNAMPSARLWGQAQSPWTLRAKWALQHAHYPYENIEYVPGGASVWVLRLALRRWRVTVPVLFTPDGRAITDSFEIAQLADGARPDGVAPLTSHEGVEAWVRDCEELLWTQRCTHRSCSCPCVATRALPRDTHSAGQRVCAGHSYASARARLRACIQFHCWPAARDVARRLHFR